MKCPYCKDLNSKVLDSRPTDDHSAIRRRRECLNCFSRYTSYERVMELELLVVKKDGSKESFDKNKIINGVIRASYKRNVEDSIIKQLADKIEKRLINEFSREVKAEYIGELIMNELKEIDEVAYVRFASVYKSFKNVEDFKDELKLVEEGTNNIRYSFTRDSREFNNKRVVTMKQVHSDNVVEVTEENIQDCYPDTDALITELNDVVLEARFADCVPIFIYDIKTNKRAIIHSGWRGTKKKIVKKVLELFKSDKENIFAEIGPCISLDNYEVGKEFLDYFDESFFVRKYDKLYFDLKKANFEIIKKYLNESNITISDECTFNNKKYYSYRRDATNKTNLGYIWKDE